jgi:hypothetical protein
LPNYDAVGDTWEWDGSTWTLRATTGPSARFLHAMAYDSDRRVVVLFGGISNGDRDDLWEWDGAIWTQRPKSGTWPHARRGQGMGYDTARHLVVMFGGEWSSGGSGINNELWEWNGATGTWTQVTQSGPWPEARTLTALSYDSARRVCVVFGGYDMSTNYSNTWEWNGTAWRNPQVAVAPAGRSAHGLTYDGARKCTVLFGGVVNPGPVNRFQNDTWLWDGVAWTQLPSELASMDTRDEMHIAYDSARQRVVLFGGWSGSAMLGDTWELH